MGAYKHIETCTGEFIASRYLRAVEVGVGNNTVAAETLAGKGVLIGCTDVREIQLPADLRFSMDDVFSPRLALYEGADVIYSIRPAIEMIPPLIDLAKEIDCDLVVYHLGFESYGNGGEVIDCGVLLHRYHKRSEHVKA
jgi:uncharacterized protein